MSNTVTLQVNAMSSKIARTFRLSEKAIKLIQRMSMHHGLSQASWLESLIRDAARAEGFLNDKPKGLKE